MRHLGVIALLLALSACANSADDSAMNDSAINAAGTMPDVRGLSEVAAREAIEGYANVGSVQVETTSTDSMPKGHVVSFEPDAGSRLSDTTVVSLVVAADAPPVVSLAIDNTTSKTLVVSSHSGPVMTLNAGETAELPREYVCSLRYLTAVAPNGKGVRFNRNNPCQHDVWVLGRS